MKAQSAGLAAHRLLPTTTLATCWKVTRIDGQVFGFTSTDVPFDFDGLRYEAATGFTPSAIQGRADLSVPNLEVAGMLDSASITEDDLLAGRWDRATVEIFEVNYKDLSMGRMVLGTGTIGNVSAGRVNFSTELRGLGQALQQPIGEVYKAACPAELGDARCGVDVEALRVAGTVTAVADRRTFTDSARAQVSDYFGAGVCTWSGGLNDGLAMEVRTFAAGVFVLQQPMPFNVQVGDTYSVVPGCRKRRDEDCQAKYNNVINFRGFPDVPLNDKVLGNAGTASA